MDIASVYQILYNMLIEDVAVTTARLLPMQLAEENFEFVINHLSDVIDQLYVLKNEAVLTVSINKYQQLIDACNEFLMYAANVLQEQYTQQSDLGDATSHKLQIVKTIIEKSQYVR